MRKTLYVAGSLLLAVLLLAPIGAEALTLSRTLYRGMPQNSETKSEVSQLQDFLTSSNYLAELSQTVKGYFGVVTEEAVQRFQDAYGLVPSRVSRDGYGIVGPATRSKIAEVTSDTVSYGESTFMPGYESDMAALGWVSNTNRLTSTLSRYNATNVTEVTILQNFLKQKGYLAAGYTQGAFDDKTEAALIKFQTSPETLGLFLSTESGTTGTRTRTRINQLLATVVPVIVTPVLAQPAAPIRTTVSLSWTPVQSGVNYEVWRRGGSRTAVTMAEVVTARQRGNVACGAVANNTSLCVVDGAGAITGNSYMDSQSKNNGEYTYTIVARRAGSEDVLSNSVFVQVRSASSLTISPENKGRSAVAGSQDALVARFTLKAGSEGAISVSQLSFSRTGNLSPNNLSKCILKNGNTTLNSGSHVVKPNSAGLFGVFSLDKPLLIEAGESKVLDLTCNVDSSGATLQTIALKLDSVAPTILVAPSLPINLGMLSVVTVNENIRTDMEMDINNNDDVDLGDMQIIVNVINKIATCPTGKVCDINGDGQITDIDSNLIINRLLGRINPAKVATSRPSPDLNGDGWVDAKDSLIIANFIAERPDRLTGTFCIPASECDINLLGEVSTHDKEFIADYYSMSPYGILRSPDIDSNGVVNQADVQFVASQMTGTQLKCVADKCNLNNDSDGLVNSDDLSIVKNYLLGEMPAPYVKNGLSYDSFANKLRWSIESDKDLVRFDILRRTEKGGNTWNVAYPTPPRSCAVGEPWFDCTKSVTMDNRTFSLDGIEDNQDYYYWIAIQRSDTVQGNYFYGPRPVVLGPVKIGNKSTVIVSGANPNVSNISAKFVANNSYPQIAWKYTHDGNHPQTAYEVFIGDTEDDVKGVTNTRVSAAESSANVVNLSTQNITLRGKEPLRSGQTYYYQVGSVYKNGTTFTTARSEIGKFTIPSLYSDLKVYTVPQELMVTLQWNRTAETKYAIFKVNGPDDYATSTSIGNKFQSYWICDNGLQRGPAEGCGSGRPQWSRHAFKGVAGTSWYQIGALDASYKVIAWSPIVKVEFPSVVTPAVKIDSLNGPDYSWRVGDAKKISWNLKYEVGVSPRADEKRKVTVSLVEVTTGVGDKSNSVDDVVKMLADYDTDNMQLKEVGEIKVAMPPVDFKANSKYALLVTSKLEGRDTPAGTDFSVPFRVVMPTPYTPLKFVESGVEKVVGAHALISAKFSGSVGDMAAASTYATYGATNSGGIVDAFRRTDSSYDIKESGNSHIDIWPLQSSKTYRYYVYGSIGPKSGEATVPARIKSGMLTFVTGSATTNHSPSEPVARKSPTGNLEKGKLYDFEWGSTDQDGDPITFSWEKSLSGVVSPDGVGGVTSPCLLNGDCVSEQTMGTSVAFDKVGTWMIKVSVDDLRGGKVTKIYTFNVVEVSQQSVSATLSAPAVSAVQGGLVTVPITVRNTGSVALSDGLTESSINLRPVYQNGNEIVGASFKRLPTGTTLSPDGGSVTVTLSQTLGTAFFPDNTIGTHYVYWRVFRGYTNKVAISDVLQISYTVQAPASTGSGGGGGSAVDPLLRNVALLNNGATPSASSVHSSGKFGLNGAIDGSRRSTVWGENVGWNDNTAGQSATSPDWYAVKFNTLKKVTKVVVVSLRDDYTNSAEPADNLTFSKYGIKDFSLEYKANDNSPWVSIPGTSVTDNGIVVRTIQFSPITASAVRIKITKAVDHWSRLVEFEVWGEDVISSGSIVTPPDAPDMSGSGGSAVTLRNLALASNGATASASSVYDSRFSVAGAINGDRKGANWGSNGGWHESLANGNSFPDTFDVSFGGSRRVSEINVFSIQDNYTTPAVPTETMRFNKYGIVDFKLQYKNGSTWTDIPNASVTGNNKVWSNVKLATPVTTDAIRLVITNTARQDVNATRYSRLAEIEVWGNDAPPSGGTPNPNTLTSVDLDGPSTLAKGSSADFVVSNKLPTTYTGGVTLKIVKSSDNSVVFTSTSGQNTVANFAWTPSTNVQEGAYKVQVWSTATPAVKVAEKDLTVTAAATGSGGGGGNSGSTVADLRNTDKLGLKCYPLNDGRVQMVWNNIPGYVNDKMQFFSLIPSATRFWRNEAEYKAWDAGLFSIGFENSLNGTDGRSSVVIPTATSAHDKEVRIWFVNFELRGHSNGQPIFGIKSGTYYDSVSCTATVKKIDGSFNNNELLNEYVHPVINKNELNRYELVGVHGNTLPYDGIKIYRTNVNVEMLDTKNQSQILESYTPQNKTYPEIKVPNTAGNYSYWMELTRSGTSFTSGPIHVWDLKDYTPQNLTPETPLKDANIVYESDTTIGSGNNIKYEKVDRYAELLRGGTGPLTMGAWVSGDGDGVLFGANYSFALILKGGKVTVASIPFLYSPDHNLYEKLQFPLSTSDNAVPRDGVHHIIYKRYWSGEERIYVDGVEKARGQRVTASTIYPVYFGISFIDAMRGIPHDGFSGAIGPRVIYAETVDAAEVYESAKKKLATSVQASAPQQQVTAQAATPQQTATATVAPAPVAPATVGASQSQAPAVTLKGCSSYAGPTASGMHFKQPATGNGGDSRIFCYDGVWHLSPSPKGLTSAGKSAEWSYFSPQVVDKACTPVGDRYLSLMNPVSKYSYYNKGDRPADCGNTSDAPVVSPYARADKESQLASAIEALRLVLEQYMALQGR